jgi:hypothetical protein
MVTITVLLVLRGIPVSESPVGETDSRGIVFADGRSVLQLERIVVVTKDDWNDMGK